MSIRKTVADLRTEYTKGSLDVADVHPDPIHQFEKWFQEAVDSEVPEPNAMTLATVQGQAPTLRVVLLKGFDERGFVFFTNYGSRKGRELAETPLAAVNFFWAELQRQVRIEGTVERISAGESDEYFQSRDRGSRLGAWASPQSQEIPDRAALEQRVVEVRAIYGDSGPVPRPEHWGGYRILPSYLEFWQGRPSRLHDRVVYEQQPTGQWHRYRIAP